MTTIEVILQLPEELVRDAREFGLLTNEQVAELLQTEVDRHVMDLVNAEIRAYRTEKAQQKSKHNKSE
jgi:hypothetical protein